MSARDFTPERLTGANTLATVGNGHNAIIAAVEDHQRIADSVDTIINTHAPITDGDDYWDDFAPQEFWATDWYIDPDEKQGEGDSQVSFRVTRGDPSRQGDHWVTQSRVPIRRYSLDKKVVSANGSTVRSEVAVFGKRVLFTNEETTEVHVGITGKPHKPGVEIPPALEVGSPEYENLNARLGFIARAAAAKKAGGLVTARAAS